jgi:DNA-binding response OmpR family regulator
LSFGCTPAYGSKAVIEGLLSLTPEQRRGTMADKVLLVDDEEEIRTLLGSFLESQGYQVVVASDGNEALDLVETEDPQVIILDLKLPGLNGIEVCKRLKEQEKTRSIPVIIITGFGDNKLLSLDVGADDFVNKPFDMTDILIRIRSALRIRHLNDELERAIAYIEELRKDPPETE